MFPRVLAQIPVLPGQRGTECRLMTVGIEKLRKFQEQHLESQVQCGEELKCVPKAGCVKEWALVEIALNLRLLNEKLDQVMRRSSADLPPGAYHAASDETLPRS